MTERIKQIESIVREAGKKLLAQEVVVSRHKTKNDLLTENDILIENFIVEKIKRFDPSASVISEENYSRGSLSGRCYVVDPIDGTCNFAAGLTLYGIQIAYFEDEVCRASVLYFPKHDDVLTAIDGNGAYFNGERVRVDPSQKAADGMLIISDYYGDVSVPMHKQFSLVEKLQPSFLKTRHFGAACIDFSLIVCGHALAYITYYSKVWDISPGLLAAKEAGCVYAAIDGSPYRYGESGLVVANSEENLKLILNAAKKINV